MKKEVYYNEVKEGDIVDIDKKLFPDSYNIKEVRILNQATIEEYVVGYVDNTPIAIIGIPDDIDIKTIRVRKNNQEIKFERVNDDLINDMEFSVYPYDKKYYTDNILKSTNRGLLLKKHNREVMEYKKNKKQKVKIKNSI